MRGLDLADGFDVSDPQAWLDVEAADLVCLNAGVLAKGDGTIDDYRRILACQRRRRRLRRPGARAEDARGKRIRRHRLAGGPDPDGVRSALRAHEARGRRLLALDGAAARAARDPDQPRLPRDRADADDRGRATDARRRRLPADGARADRRGDPGRRPERGDRPGVGLPARPRAVEVQVPERPRPARRGRRGYGAAADEARAPARSTTIRSPPSRSRRRPIGSASTLPGHPRRTARTRSPSRAGSPRPPSRSGSAPRSCRCRHALRRRPR